jgi:uncharacterized protein (TIGR02145 family)
VGTTGYNAKSLTATMQGDYYFEFRYTGSADRCKFKYFDITVASPANIAIPGRVWSKGWQFTADATGNSFLGKLYVYADDGIVTSINFNSMDPFVFTVFCNQNGTDPASTDWLTNRRSRYGKFKSPQYKIFLNNPDNDPANPTYTFPTGQLGSIVPPIGLEANCNGTGLFTVNVTKPGKVNLLLDIDPTPGVQPIDVEIPWDFLVAGPTQIPWNGINGLGQPVVNGTSIIVSVAYINGLTNLPIYDVEANPSGFIVELIRPKPPGTPDPPLEWDDHLINGGLLSPPGGCNYLLPVTGCHTWDISIGDNNTINTWWYSASTSLVAAEPFIEKRAPQPLSAITAPENAFCAGSFGKVFSVTPDPNSTTYTWTFTGSDYVVHGNGPSVTIDFGPNSASGNLTVTGNNIACGAGPAPSPAFPITIVPPPVVTVTPNLIDLCSDEQVIQLEGGSPAGGTYLENGIPITSFNPQTAAAGPHTITYTYSTPPPAVCTNNATLTIHVNTAPVVTLADFPDACINDAPIPLNNGTPEGGNYTGTGVVANEFIPSLAGVGVHQITYQLISPEGCTDQMVKPILVNPIPSQAGPVSPAISSVCQGASHVFSIPPAANASDYLWSVVPSNAASTLLQNPFLPNEVTITFYDTYTGPAEIHVKGQNGCGDGPEFIQFLTVKPRPVVAVKLCDDIITTTSGRLIRMKWGLPLGGVYSRDGVALSDQEVFDPKNAGGAGNKVITYTYTNHFQCENTATLTIQVKSPPSFVQCGTSTIKDVRNNGLTYETFQAGTGASAKCWIASNLDFGALTSQVIPQSDNSNSEKYCLQPDPLQCTRNDMMYQWDELMQYENPSAGFQDLCMPGWHVPTDSEWQQLMDFVANMPFPVPGAGIAGSYLKYPNPTGFDAMLKGIYYLNDSWSFSSGTINATMFWTSTLSGSKAIARGLNTQNPSVSLYESSRANAFPVRCVKD